MNLELEEFGDGVEYSPPLRERLAWWLYSDTGTCDFCDGPLPEAHKAIQLAWKGGLLDGLLPNVAKLCSPACLVCHMEVAFPMPGLAGDVLDKLDGAEERNP